MIKNLRPKLAEAGKIKIGGLGAERPTRAGGTFRVPVKLDHFLITKTTRENGDPKADLEVNAEVMGSLVSAGFADKDGKIRAIPIVLHSDAIDEVFPTAYVAYTGQRLNCRGDGETAERRVLVNGKWTGESSIVPCPCDRLQPDAKGTRRCKYNGQLHCSIRIPGQAVAGAIHRWRTTSQISCEQMFGSLLQIQQAVGVLQGLPLVLRVRGVNVDPVGGRPSTVYVCHVELRATDLQTVQRQALELAQMRGALAGKLTAAAAGDYRAMLQAPGAETEQEEADLAAEYYPEVIGETPAGATVVATAPALPPLTPGQQARLQSPALPPHPAPVMRTEPVHPGPAAYRRDTEPPPEPENASPPSTQEPVESPKRTRRTRCRTCKELKTGVQMSQCPDCRALGAGELGDTPPPAAGERNMACARCNSGPYWPAQMSPTPGGLVCGECAVVLGMADPPPAAASPPSRPAGPDEKSPQDVVLDAVRAGVSEGRFDQNQALNAVQACPDVGDNSHDWEPQDAAAAIVVLADLDHRRAP